MIFSVASLQAQTKVGDVPKLLQDLNSTDPALRGSAAAALDNLHDPAAVSMLVSALRHSHNASATPVLVRILGRFDDANAVAAIADLLSTDAGVIASQQLLQMGERGTQAVVGALASDDERTRANVSEAFKSDPDLTLKVLPAVLRTSKSAMQREQIVGVLADSVAQNPSYEDPPRASFVEGFLPGASDAVPSVRIAVASAVQQLAEMEKELADSRFGPPDFALGRALPALQSLAEDRDSAVRVAAVDALGAMGRADAISILKKHVHDPDPTVREHVETAVAAGEHTPLPASSSQPAAKNAELRATTNDNAEVHRLALIKEWNDEAAIPKLVPLLHDPSSLVRAAAADKLGQLDYRATAMSGEDHQQNLSEVPALIRALKDPHALVRAAAAEALGEIGDERAASHLTDSLKDPKPKVIVAAAGALSMMVTDQGYAQDALTPEDHKAAGKGLVDLLSSSDQSVRRAAVSALVNVGILDNMKHIVPLLKDDDVFMRTQAASTLERAFRNNPNSERPPELEALEQAAGPALSELLSNKESRGAALSALEAMKTPPADAVHPLIETLKYNVWIQVDGTARPEIQSTPFNGFQRSEIDQAIDVLAKTGSPEAEPLLVEFLSTVDPGAAKHASAGLAVLKDPRAIGPLLDVLQEPGIWIQPDAALALGSFQDSRSVPALIACLQSDNATLRGASASALSHFRDPRVAPALIHSLTDEDAAVRVNVAEALGDLGDLAAVDPLGRVAKTNYKAVRALVNLNSPGSVAPLVSVMQDKQSDYSIRVEAVAALGKLQNPEAVPALIQTMEHELSADPSSPLAVPCIQALGIIKDPRAVEPLRMLLGKPTMASQEAERVLTFNARLRRRGALRCQVTTHLGLSGLGSLKLI